MNLFSTPDAPRGLAAGTLVITPEGLKRIEKIVVGDKALCGIGEGKVDFYEVKKASAKPYNGPMLWIRTGNDDFEIAVTPNHICFGFSKGDKPNKNSVEFRMFDRLETGSGIPTHYVDGDRIIGFDQAEEYARKASFYKGRAQIERFADFRFSKSFRIMPASDLRYRIQIPAIIKNLRREQRSILRSVTLA